MIRVGKTFPRIKTMPGALIHLATGAALYLVGRISFKSFFTGDEKLKNNLLLLLVCLVFSMLPDFFMGIYYLTHLEPASVLMPYQIFTHLIITPAAIGVLLSISFLDRIRRPLWLMGATALTLHIILDLFITETNYLW
jgi:membrane-bound metal-dependent hydrolase YbcI (DUF457 family)